MKLTVRSPGKGDYRAVWNKDRSTEAGRCIRPGQRLGIRFRASGRAELVGPADSAPANWGRSDGHRRQVVGRGSSYRRRRRRCSCRKGLRSCWGRGETARAPRSRNCRKSTTLPPANDIHLHFYVNSILYQMIFNVKIEIIFIFVKHTLVFHFILLNCYYWIKFLLMFDF